MDTNALTPEERDALKKVLNYLWIEESKSFKAASKSEKTDHIFRALVKLDQLAKRTK